MEEYFKRLAQARVSQIENSDDVNYALAEKLTDNGTTRRRKIFLTFVHTLLTQQLTHVHVQCMQYGML